MFNLKLHETSINKDYRTNSMEGKGIKEKSILPDEGSLISPLEKSTTLQKTKIKNHGVGQGGQERTTSDGVLPPKF